MAAIQPLNSEYEISLDNNSVIEDVTDDPSVAKIPTMNFNVRAPLADVLLPRNVHLACIARQDTLPAFAGMQQEGY